MWLVATVLDSMVADYNKPHWCEICNWWSFFLLKYYFMSQTNSTVYKVGCGPLKKTARYSFLVNVISHIRIFLCKEASTLWKKKYSVEMPWDLLNLTEIMMCLWSGIWLSWSGSCNKTIPQSLFIWYKIVNPSVEASFLIVSLFIYLYLVLFWSIEIFFIKMYYLC